MKAVRAFLSDEHYRDWLKHMLAEFSPVGLRVIANVELRHAIDYLPELVQNLCQGDAAGMVLARNAIRSLPRTEVDRRLSANLVSIVEGMSTDELSQLVDLLVELRMEDAVKRLTKYAATHPLPEMRQLADELEGIEHDQDRWGLRRSERRLS